MKNIKFYVVVVVFEGASSGFTYTKNVSAQICNLVSKENCIGKYKLRNHNCEIYISHVSGMAAGNLYYIKLCCTHRVKDL